MPRAVDQPIRDALWQAHQKGGLDSLALAVRFGIPRRTVQNLLHQAHANNDTMTPAAYQCPQPASVRLADDPVFLQAQALRHDHAHWGTDMIRVVLAEHFPKDRFPDVQLPSARALARWFVQLHLSPAPPGRPCPFVYHRATNVHQTWQGDAADQVALATGDLASCFRCVDECTGAFLGSRVFPQVFNCVPATLVRASVRDLFGQYGLPSGMRLDNGLPWGGGGSHDLPSAFALWLVGLGLELTFNPARQPRYNGVVEKSHETNQRWSEPDQATSAADWQGRIDAMDRRQREAYPYLDGRSRMDVFPQLKASGRPYTEGWEETNWEVQRAREYLAGYVARRRVSSGGRVTLYHRPYYVGRKHAGATVLAHYDPQACEWFMTEEGGGQIRRWPAPEICRDRIIALDISAE